MLGPTFEVCVWAAFEGEPPSYPRILGATFEDSVCIAFEGEPPSYPWILGVTSEISRKLTATYKRGQFFRARAQAGTSVIEA